MSEWLGHCNLYNPTDFHFIAEHMSWLRLRLLVSIQLYLISLISPASITFQYSWIYLETLSHLLNINKSEDQLSLSLSLIIEGKACLPSSALHCTPKCGSCLIVVLLKCCRANISIYKIDFLSASQFVFAGPRSCNVYTSNYNSQYSWPIVWKNYANDHN